MSGSVEFSAMFVSELLRVLSEGPLREELLSNASPDLKAMIQSPASKGWWPSPPMFEFIEAVVSRQGREHLKRLCIQASHNRMGPIARPLVNIFLLVAGATPETLFSRAGTFVSIGVRTVVTRWNSTGPKSGTVSFRFPGPVPADLSLLWWGMLVEGFTILKNGRVAREDITPEVHTFDLEWD